MINLNDPNMRAAYSAGQQSMAQQLRQAQTQFEEQRRTLEGRFNQLAGHQRKQLDHFLQAQERQMDNFTKVADAMKMFVAGREEMDPGVVRIEDIPGRRVPFTLLVDIPIGPDVTSVREQSVNISMEGPFVATRRMATFISSFEYTAANETTGATARLAGRSSGRYRPIHSAADLVDSQHNAVSDPVAWFNAATVGPPAAGTILPTGSLSLPSNMSSFRTMEFDGRVTVIDAGSSVPRQQISVPTPFWSQYINSPFDLSCLDFFERGSIITFRVQPTHVNNPAAGNVDGECVFPAAAVSNGAFGYPFVGGQYDSHEGVCTPNGVVMGDAALDYDPALSDPIVRLPSGILTIGYEGYKIFQGIAPVP